MSNIKKITTTLVLTAGFAVITLYDGLQGIWNGDTIEFDADPDTVAEHAVISGRTDLLPLLKHQREELIDDYGDGLKTPKLVQVVYNPLGRPVFQEIPDDLEVVAPVVLDDQMTSETAAEESTQYVAMGESLAVKNPSGVEPFVSPETGDLTKSADGADAVEFAENAGVFGADARTVETVDAPVEPEQTEPEQTEPERTESEQIETEQIETEQTEIAAPVAEPESANDASAEIKQMEIEPVKPKKSKK